MTGLIFESRITFITDLVQPLSLPILEQLPACKECIREAAFYIQHALNFNDSGGRENKRLTLESLARAVWHEDVGLARKLLDATMLARTYIEIVANRITVLDPPVFEEACMAEREYYHSQQIADAKRMFF